MCNLKIQRKSMIQMDIHMDCSKVTGILINMDNTSLNVKASHLNHTLYHHTHLLTFSKWLSLMNVVRKLTGILSLADPMSKFFNDLAVIAP